MAVILHTVLRCVYCFSKETLSQKKHKRATYTLTHKTQLSGNSITFDSHGIAIILIKSVTPKKRASQIITYCYSEWGLGKHTHVGGPLHKRLSQGWSL